MPQRFHLSFRLKFRHHLSPARFVTFIAPQHQAAHAQDLPRWIERGTAGLAALDSHLGHREFITDDGYTVADIAVFGHTHLAEEGGFSLEKFPAVCEWIKRVETQPGYWPIDQLLASRQIA